MALMLYIYPWINISDTYMPYCKTHTETVVAVAITIVVEVEWTGIGIVIVASTFEEWIIVAAVQTDKVRVRSGKSPLYLYIGFSLRLRSTEKFLMF